jgi:hypothetical protein
MQNILVLKQKGRFRRPFLSDAKTFLSIDSLVLVM